MTSPEQLALEFARANPRWGTQRGATGKCHEASFRYGITLGGCSLIRADCGIGDHVAVVIPDGRVVDLTMRQFDPTLPFPLITDVSTWCQMMQDTFPRETFFGFDRVA